jgi:hypothetical protein
MVSLDFSKKGTGEKAIYKLLLIEAQNHPSKRLRRQALDFIKDGVWPNFESLPENTLQVLRNMAKNSNYEPRDHATDILEWLEFVIEGRKQSGMGNHFKE